MHHVLSFLLISVTIAGMASSASAQNCSNTSVGLKPLTELGTGTYQGYPGGLYSQGQNQRPAAHETAGRALAQQVQSLNAAGAPDSTNGKIVLLSIGMSNTTQEFSVFKSIADADPVKNPRVVIVDGAQGGQTAAIISSPSAAFWDTVSQRLARANVTPSQVQVAWVKEANAGPTQAFPVHAQMLQANLESIARNLKLKYPNIKIAYYSSRIYAGYATTTLNPEPYAYESGFSVKWMIEKQINGDTSLAYSGSNARAPWLAWGPYLWADGLTTRSDGLKWECLDFQTDGTHPNTTARQKVAQLLLTFLKSDPTATPWFVKTTTQIERVGKIVPSTARLEQNYPNPFNPTTTIEFGLPRAAHVNLNIYDLTGKEVMTLADGEYRSGAYRVTWDARALPSGVYYCRMASENFAQTRAMVLLR